MTKIYKIKNTKEFNFYFLQLVVKIILHFLHINLHLKAIYLQRQSNQNTGIKIEIYYKFRCDKKYQRFRPRDHLDHLDHQPSYLNIYFGIYLCFSLYFIYLFSSTNPFCYKL